MEFDSAGRRRPRISFSISLIEIPNRCILLVGITRGKCSWNRQCASSTTFFIFWTQKISILSFLSTSLYIRLDLHLCIGRFVNSIQLAEKYTPGLWNRTSLYFFISTKNGAPDYLEGEKVSHRVSVIIFEDRAILLFSIPFAFCDLLLVFFRRFV